MQLSKYFITVTPYDEIADIVLIFTQPVTERSSDLLCVRVTLALCILVDSTLLPIFETSNIWTTYLSKQLLTQYPDLLGTEKYPAFSKKMPAFSKKMLM